MESLMNCKRPGQVVPSFPMGPGKSPDCQQVAAPIPVPSPGSPTANPLTGCNRSIDVPERAMGSMVHDLRAIALGSTDQGRLFAKRPGPSHSSGQKSPAGVGIGLRPWGGKDRGPHGQVVVCRVEGRRPYQTRQEFSGTMGWPFLQPKALPKASKFWTVPFTRQRPGACGSVSALWRAMASVRFSHHTWAKPIK